MRRNIERTVSPDTTGNRHCVTEILVQFRERHLEINRRWPILHKDDP